MFFSFFIFYSLPKIILTSATTSSTFKTPSTLRSLEIIGEGLGGDIRELSRYSFLVAMVAIGMGVDVRDILKVGPKVVVVIAAVLLFMVTITLIGGSYL